MLQTLRSVIFSSVGLDLTLTLFSISSFNVFFSSIVLTAFHVNIYVKVSLIYFSLKSNK